MNHRRACRGYSLIEVVAAGAIALILAAIATPSVMTTLDAIRLRSAASNVAGVLQATRMAAIQQNHARGTGQVTESGQTILYADLYADTDDKFCSFQRAEPHATLSSQITVNSTGCSDIDPLTPTFTLGTGNAAFNSHGMPVDLNCTTQTASGNVGHVYYLQQARTMGTPGCAAVALTPSGVVRVYMWNGTQWK